MLSFNVRKQKLDYQRGVAFLFAPGFNIEQRHPYAEDQDINMKPVITEHENNKLDIIIQNKWTNR